MIKTSFWLIVSFLILTGSTFAQDTIQGRVIDANTKLLLSNVAIHINETNKASFSDQSGKFTILMPSSKDTLIFSFIGYKTLFLNPIDSAELLVQLQPIRSSLQNIVVTASRSKHSRTDEAVAINTLSSETIKETNATHLTQLLDKVPGVLMQDLGNEQHAMSIRQPMTKNPFFLYLEDGIPIAPVGAFNHNQLIGVNMLGIQSIEVIKGPASSFYGSDAVGGVVNFITKSPTYTPTAQIGLQANNYGYRRLEFYAGNYLNDKLGISLNGYMAKQRNGWQQYSDLDKGSLSFKTIYQLNNKSALRDMQLLTIYILKRAGM